MTVADCDRDLWRSGRRQCPSHDIDCEYRVDLRSACSPPFAVPGIGESAGGEAAQCFDPLITRGVTRVGRGRYPIWGCSGLQQLTRLPSRPRTAESRGILSIGARTIELKCVPSQVPLGPSTTPSVEVGPIEVGAVEVGRPAADPRNYDFEHL